VVVDAAGKARSVLATREPSDPNRELWWAHTGCGGGNFGIVTRYFFRSPGASGNDPTELLPKAPQEVTTFKVEWDWKQLDEASFVALVRNYGQWYSETMEAWRTSCPRLPVWEDALEYGWLQVVQHGMGWSAQAVELTEAGRARLGVHG
jgi:hypothetical protein